MVHATAPAALIHDAASAFTRQRRPHSAHAAHRAQASGATAAMAAAEREPRLLDLDDARFFLTRTGFAPNHTELAQYAGLTREQSVDKLFATARTETVVPLPDRVSEPIPTRAERDAWTPEQRRDQQRERNRRYELLRAW